MLGHRFGAHRVLEPRGALPQPAERLDADAARIFEDEVIVDVETLNVDAASFRQIEGACDGSEAAIAATVLATVARRGKQHNPVTGSGGMLLGRVARVGSASPDRGLAEGDRVATLASLSLTPLALRAVRSVRRASCQLDVEGTAIVFASAPLAKLPTDLPERLALALYDVAGAAPQVTRHVAEGDLVVVLGAGGKSGMIACLAARRAAGPRGRVIGIEPHRPFADDLRSLGPCDAVLEVDARDPLAVRGELLGATSGREADVAVSCVDVAGVEMSAILATRQRGRIYFFSMSTSFTAAALGAEGVGRDVDMFVGNGYAEGHAEATLALARGAPRLLEVLGRRYG